MTFESPEQTPNPKSPDDIYVDIFAEALHNQALRSQGQPSPDLVGTVNEGLMKYGNSLNPTQTDILVDAMGNLRRTESDVHEQQLNSALETMHAIGDSGSNLARVITSLEQSSTSGESIPTDTMVSWLKDVYEKLVVASESHSRQTEPILKEEALLYSSNQDHRPLTYTKLPKD